MLLASAAPPRQAERALFDGESLAGWETVEADQHWWSVEGGELRGGSLDERVTHNSFLATRESFQNFDLRLSIRLEGSGGMVNSGVQIRSTRVAGSSEMSGYQVDAGDGWWGKLYDESRRNRVIAEPLEPQAVAAVVRSNDWNEYHIRAEGARIRSWINGVPALDYTEPELDTPLDGKIAIQVHSGERVLVRVKDVQLQVLPPTPDAMSWRRLAAVQAGSAPGAPRIQSAEQERAGFDLLEGFEVELVASDPSMQKVVDIAFDDAGRLWAITAVEYPIDANESAGAAELYRQGGRDQVLVFDEPWQPGPQVPRVFADGLFIPMALLPEQDSVLIGQGPEILRLIDEDGDGRADRRELVLSGFGIQDSHLLPHRFVRAPGRWIYLAQGAFNSSRVETRTGAVVPFDKCKLGRFQSDGSRFEVVGMGLNNIWGFVIDRLGDKWIQEANDLGYPLVPFEHGNSFPGIGMDRFQPYSPWQPSLASFRMGGTGLSGLALSQDVGGFPAPWNETFFVANPITSRVQSIRARRDEARPSEVELERVADLLVSTDKNFRPIALHFGPDGCLYVVDWYNPIISHNEVPRDHPDRDKTSSRIWRIRHRSQARVRPLDVAHLPNDELLAALRSGTTLVARAAWHQIGRRGAVELEPELVALARDVLARTQDRVLALWSLEDLGRAELALASALSADPAHAIRREACRLAGQLEADGASLARLFARVPDERDPRVRQAAIESLSALPTLTPEVAALLLRFLRPLPDGPRVQLSQNSEWTSTGESADRAFERSRVRAALAARPGEWSALLDSEQARGLELETHLFACLCAGGPKGATRLARELGGLEREPTAEEAAFLARQLEAEGVEEFLCAWLARPAARARALALSLDSLDSLEAGGPTSLAPALIESARALCREQPEPASYELLLRLARERRLPALEPDILALFDRGELAVGPCLQALIELGSDDAERFFELASGGLPGEEPRRLAVAALAAVPGEAAFALLLELWPALDRAEARAAIAAALTRAESSRRLVQAVGQGEIELELLDGATLARLREQLGEDPLLDALAARVAQASLPALRLAGGGEDYAVTQLALPGPFTLEAWVRLDAGITNADGLLCAPGQFDFNFHDARPRLWSADGGDLIIARRRVEAERWTHVALTRAADGELRLYLDGELDSTAHPAGAPAFEGLDVGRTNPGAGTAAWIAELRVWSVARDAAEIGADFRLRLEAGSRPAELLLQLPGDEVALSGAARIEGTLEAPPVWSAAEQRAEAERFARYRGLAEAPGNLARGREAFVTTCAGCHRVGGQGASIGPVLDGVGSKGVEGLLRSILTPNAGVESGYRTLILRTSAGELLDGFLAEETPEAVVLRRKDREDLRIARREIESARFDRLSLMPEGLLESLTPVQVTDLLAYLQSLK